MKALLKEQRQINHAPLKLHLECLTQDCVLCHLPAPNSFHAQISDVCKQDRKHHELHCSSPWVDTHREYSVSLKGKCTSEEIPLSYIDFGIYNLLTTVTASFRSDSPKTMMNRTSLTWTSSNTARTATGSTAAIKLPKRRKSSSPDFSSPSKTKPTNHKQNNLCIIISNDRLGCYR